MGAGTSKQDAPPQSVVSRYHEFVTEGLTDTDRTLISKIPLDQHGIMRSRQIPQIDVLTANKTAPLINHFCHQMANIVTELSLNHSALCEKWRNEFYMHKQTEQVDLSEVTDWFPIFVYFLNVTGVHIVITTQLDTIKLHRVLTFLFFLGRARMHRVAISFASSLTYLVEHSMLSAKHGASQLDGTAFEDIVHARGNVIDMERWILTKNDDGMTTTWTFKYSSPWYV